MARSPESTVLHHQQMEFVSYVRCVRICPGKMDTPQRIGFGNSRISHVVIRSDWLRWELIARGQRIFARGSGGLSNHEEENSSVCHGLVLQPNAGAGIDPALRANLGPDANPEKTVASGYHHMPLEDIERFVILSRIERCRGNKTEAAAELGVTARTLRNKLARWNELEKAS